MKNIEDFSEIDHVGIDESGKGDVLGPLVISGVLYRTTDLEFIKEHNIRDSKMISDNVILKLAGIIKKNMVYDTIIIRPAKYNELYLKMKNINRIISWAHKKVIENIRKDHDFKVAISDKFSKIERFSNVEDVNVYFFEKGEKDPAVACASILARSEFITSMKELSEKYEMEIPKGASKRVDDFICEFIKEHKKELKDIAKMHFKNVKIYE